MELPNGVQSSPDGDLELDVDKCIEFEVPVNGKMCKILLVRYKNEDETLENFGLKLHKDNRDMEFNEVYFALLKKLYQSLRMLTRTEKVLGEAVEVLLQDESESS